MWPFGSNPKIQDQAQQVGPMLIEALTEFHPTFVKYLLGEDSKVSQKALSDLAMEELVLCLHVLDRLVSTKFGPQKRAVFMDALLPAACEAFCQRHFGGEWLRRQFQTLYNERQLQYSGYRKLLPDKEESAKDTLFWEFGKMMSAKYGNWNPVRLGLVMLRASDILEPMHYIVSSLKG